MDFSRNPLNICHIGDAAFLQYFDRDTFLGQLMSAFSNFAKGALAYFFFYIVIAYNSAFFDNFCSLFCRYIFWTFARYLRLRSFRYLTVRLQFVVSCFFSDLLRRTFELLLLLNNICRSHVEIFVRRLKFNLIQKL